MPSVEGVPARRAALQMLDAVLRRGLTIDAAGQQVRGLSPPDHALAVAIAGETMRRLPDLDLLIDSATRQRLPDDSKARMVLRLALAQKVGLGTPDHALVATALPLVDGGPRRLVHGVLGTLLRRGLPALEAPRLPPTVEERWRSDWGDDVIEAARRQIARRPPLDLTFTDDSEAKGYGSTALLSRSWPALARAAGGCRTSPRHCRHG
jgi:16S rRNA (cytosine967-C5)-methyltransferase